MALLKNASIRERLTAIIMAASTVSVLLTTLTISIIGVWTLRQNLLAELEVSASIVGDRNTAALLFADDQLAASNMQVFSSRRSVLRACLYDKEGRTFARYFNEAITDTLACPASTGSGASETSLYAFALNITGCGPPPLSLLLTLISRTA